MNHDLRSFLTHALRIVDGTGAWIRERRRSSFSVARKPDDSFVTEIDLEVERRIRTALLARWPDHRVEGEEDGESGGGPYRWTVDPIDGTMSLRSGVPLFGTILALHHEDVPLVGIIQLPAIERCYWAARGLGAHCNGERIRLTDTEAIDDEIVAMGDRAQFVRTGRETLFDGLMRDHRWARTYADCFGHALAIDGSVGAMIDVDLKPWDVAATEVLVTEAGGRYERLPGAKTGREDVVFGKPAVVEWILERVAAESRA